MKTQSFLLPSVNSIHAGAQKAPDTPPVSPPPPSPVTAEEKRLLAAMPAPEAEKPPADSARKISRELVVNRLNFVHFQDECIQVHFSHRRYDRRLVIPVMPQPCFGDELEFRWSAPGDMPAVLQSFQFEHILVPRGQRFIRVVPEIVELTAEGARLKLPAVSYEITHRKVERQSCSDISVYLLQNSSSFAGRLLDFNAFSFRVELKAAPPQRFDWIDPALPANVVFFKGPQTFFTGECSITRCTDGESTRGFVLEPLKQEIVRYRKAEFRSQRQALTPSPNLIFRHPLTGRRVDLSVIDLSGSGFAVEEEEPSAVLMPGLTLPKVEIWFANSFKLTCSAQVVFRKFVATGGDKRSIRCGLALIDMSAEDHVKLLAMLHQGKDRNSYICNELDLDALWDFLFETGFIYPHKYASIYSRKKEIKETYEKVYTRNPQIARHFVYQNNGVILGHMAMIRFWHNTWMIHHHAARKSALNKAGLVVLDQISRFIHDTFRIQSLHTNFLACYYRPQNRFPHRVFGGFARSLNDPRACSLDPFAYLHLSGPPQAEERLPESWRIDAAGQKDVEDLNDFYTFASGGLMLKAFDLAPTSWRMDELSHEFRRLGLKRERRLLALNHGDRLKAFIIANVSEIGLNLSDLTHCLQVVVIDPEGLSPEIFANALRSAARMVGLEEVLALVHPVSYLQDRAIAFEKTYNLWVFDIVEAGQPFSKFIGRLTRYV
jgi:hypothetical protein